MAKTSTTKALTLVSAKDVRALVETNQGGRLDASQLDRIRIPAGGALAWEVPTLDGEESYKEIEGVIVHITYQNAYWATGIDESGGGTPPDCAAIDAKTGLGNPGGDCAVCPLNQWGSDQRGSKGKACKNLMILFIQQPGAILPMAVILPPTSIKAAKKYFMRLTSAGIPYYAAVSVLSLEKAKNENGIAYSTLAIKPKRLHEDAPTAAERIMLDEATIKQIEQFRKVIVPALDAVDIATDAIVDDEGDTTDDF